MIIMLTIEFFEQFRPRKWSHVLGKLRPTYIPIPLCIVTIADCVINRQTMVNEETSGDSLERKLILGSTNAIA